MFKKSLLALIAAAISLWAYADERVIWEGSKALPDDWSDYLTIDASAFDGISYFSQINVRFNDLCPENEGWALAMFQDGLWQQLTSMEAESFQTFLTDGYKEGQFSRTPLIEDVNAILSNGLIINGCHVTITRVSVVESETPRLLHDMVWGENSGFELPSSSWQCFGNHMNAVHLNNPGFCIEGESCIEYTNTEAGDSWDNQMNYVFPSPLTPGKYKLIFLARMADGQSGQITSRLMDDRYSGTGYASHSITDGWNYYESEIDVTADNITTVGFQLGQEAGNYYIDDIHFGPYIPSTPDKNILWRGNNKLYHDNIAGLIRSVAVNAGDEIAITFDDLSMGSNGRMWLEDLSTGLPVNGAADFCRQDAEEMTVRIAVTDQIAEALRSKGLAVRASGDDFTAATLKAIDRRPDIFGGSGYIAAGYRAAGVHHIHSTLADDCGFIGLQFSETDPAMGSETLITLQAAADGQVERVDLSSATVTKSTSSSCSAVFPISAGMRALVNKSGTLTISANCPWTAIYSNPVIAPDPSEAVKIWSGDYKLLESGFEPLAFSPALFTTLKGGDRIIVHTKCEDNAAILGSSFYFRSPGTDRFMENVWLDSQDINPSGIGSVTLTLTDQLAADIREYGLGISGWDNRITDVYLKCAEYPAGEGIIFYGYKNVDFTTDHFDIPTAGFKAGDVLRFTLPSKPFWGGVLMFGIGDDINNLPGAVPIDYCRSGNSFIYQFEIGITEALAADMPETITVSGFTTDVNMVEHLPGVFDPSGVLCYTYTNPAVCRNVTLTIPDDATELTATLDKFNDSEEITFSIGDYDETFYTAPSEDFAEDSAIPGRYTLRIPVTAEIRQTVNRLGELVYESTGTLRILRVTDRQSGISEVGTDENAPAEYFNLQGIRVQTPVPGNIYIRRQGGKAEKVIL